MQKSLVSTSRLPMDHFLSGALLGFITAGSINYAEFKNGKIDKKEALKNSFKFTIQGGIATSCAIVASNKLVQKNFLGATFYTLVGLASIITIENLIQEEKDDE